MKITVLVDNYTYIDRYYYGEPGLSFYIENDRDNILFDLGYSDIYLKNMSLMGIDKEKVNKILFSHGHNDHIGGLKHWHQSTPDKIVDIITHPHTFKKRLDEVEEYGTDLSEGEIMSRFNVIYKTIPYQFSDRLFYLGEIPEINDFEVRENMGTIYLDEESCEINNIRNEIDLTLDDSALVYDGVNGLTIITGCSHSGICNIIEYAKQITNKNTVNTIIGGLHLFKANEQLRNTIRYLKDNSVRTIYPCHCTSLNVKVELSKHFIVEEVGVGLNLSFD